MLTNFYSTYILFFVLLGLASELMVMIAGSSIKTEPVSSMSSRKSQQGSNRQTKNQATNLAYSGPMIFTTTAAPSGSIEQQVVDSIACGRIQQELMNGIRDKKYINQLDEVLNDIEGITGSIEKLNIKLNESADLEKMITDCSKLQANRIFRNGPLQRNKRTILEPKKRYIELNETAFGMPTRPSGLTIVDPIEKDLAKASNDLQTLLVRLDKTADSLRHTNHTIHSVLLQALRAYVASIGRRVDNERTLHKNFNGAELIGRIALVTARMDILMERLKTMTPFRLVTIKRDDREEEDSSGFISTTNHDTYIGNVTSNIVRSNRGFAVPTTY